MRTPASVRGILIITAWVATFLLGKLLLMIARDLFDIDILWITPAWVVAATLLFVAAFIWQSLKPLQSYFIVLGVIYLWTVLDSMIRGTVIWQSFFAGQSEMVVNFADQILIVLLTFTKVG